MIGWWRGVSRALFSLLGPKREVCLLCKQMSSLELGELGLCHSCYTSIPWIRKVICPTCGRSEFCPDCRRMPHTHFARNRSAVRYDETMKELLARYKYRGDERLKAVLGHMLVHAFQLLQGERKVVGAEQVREFITYVPVSERRMQERGFNQAEQMAVELGRRVGVPVVSLLRRAKHTDKQSFKKRNERIDDLAHVFEVNAAGQLELSSQGATILLYIVDDVYTTGSTMNQCALTIKDILSVNVEIVGLTWAR
ncbi:ComF family protein [Paenibacillus roseipurpureus]|uniref:ComF family protein n=1 Tax=Paenibacillus roseopurpureus TaxID=2918901 RepID=A0AA96LMF4_9BACL|nr:ComF family protein [Paenibacillus sp. MBLB1832]WNR44687.1 ComF family protein [Paenibacillus sp. MBLB1832]